MAPLIAQERSKSIPVVPGKVRQPMDLTQLDRQDTTILRGLAISAIVLHNFFHAVSPVRENEFVFHQGGFAVFLHTVRHPSLAIQAFFSFFGYLGVPVFIFLSSYGLAKSHWEDIESWAHFMANRVRKLFPIFGLVVLPWMLVMAFQTGPQPFLRNVFPQIAFLFAGLTPFVPGLDLPPVGPWWFIPFILEFYAIFFVVRKIAKTFGWQGLLVLALAGVAVSAGLEACLARWSINVYESPLGRMPSLCLGIAAARYSFRISRPVVMAAAGVLVLGSLHAALWPFTFSASAVLILWVYQAMRSNLRECRTLERLGRYSMLIFLLNGIVRNQFLSFATTPALQLVFGCISALASFVIAATIQDVLLDPGFMARNSGEARERAA